MKPKKLEYRGTDKVKLYFQRCINWLLDNSGKTEVNVEPNLSTGVKVADITVDEETTSIFAPNPPTVKNNISEMNDVELTDLADGQILKYDNTEEKWVNANETGGTDVEANPQGTPTDTLNSIAIDGVIYGIEGGGGGSTLPFDIVIDPNDNGINLIYSQLINGITKVYDSNDSGISSYTIEESGIYMVINTYSANSTHEITVPQSARIINSGNLGSDRGVSWIIAELQDNDEVTINTIPSNWVAFSKVVYRIDGISIKSLVDTSYQSDGTATYTPPQDNNHYLMVGVSMGRAAGLYRNDTDTSSSSCDIMIEQDIGVNTTIGIYYGIGNQLPQANFYGYDGGCSCIFNYLTGGE